MKKSELTEIVKTIVKAELKKTLPSMIAEEIAKSSCLIEEDSESLYRKAVKNVGGEAKNPKLSKKSSIKYSNNDLLNSILTETADAIEKESGGVDESEWDSMSFRSNMAQVMGYGGENFNVQSHKKNQNSIVAPDGISPDQIPDSLKKVLSRDYSSLVKTMVKK